MSNDTNPTLSRRKVLGTAGTIGAAGALGGAGTMAFFSDEEEFANNQLTAGELDMKVSWEEHYSDWSEDEAEYAHMENGELVIDDQQGFKNATLQEQFPDKQVKRSLDQGMADPCEVLADVPDNLQKPVIEISDVKPGDFGEITFDFALCNNPGFVWMTGDLLENAEQGVVEPEADNLNEDGSSSSMGGELAEAIQVTIWHDFDCDNVLDDLEDPDLASTPFSVDLDLDSDGAVETVASTTGLQVGTTQVMDGDTVEAGVGTDGGFDHTESDIDDDGEDELVILTENLEPGEVETKDMDNDTDPDIVWIGVGKTIFFEGPLMEALTMLSQSHGLPLDGRPVTHFDEVVNGNPAAGDNEDRECFTSAPDRHCIGFKWELPADHGNEVQSDSIRFDLGFFTEQCRHNTVGDIGGTDGPRVTLVSTDEGIELPIEPGVEIVREAATPEHPPRLQTTLTNTSDGALTVGEGRAVHFEYLADGSETLTLLPGDSEREYPAELGCWRLTKGIGVTQEYQTFEIEAGESSSRPVDLYATPNVDGCLPVGEYRFETTISIATDDAEPQSSANWGFSILLE